MVYEKNLGFQEMMEFVQVATPEEQMEMDKVVEKEDWEGYRKLISRVLNLNLKKE